MTFWERVRSILFGTRPQTAGDRAYLSAMNLSRDIRRRMQETSNSSDAALAVMADIWAQHHNIPYVTTMFETSQEMKSPLEQQPSNPDEE